MFSLFLDNPPSRTIEGQAQIADYGLFVLRREKAELGEDLK